MSTQNNYRWELFDSQLDCLPFRFDALVLNDDAMLDGVMYGSLHLLVYGYIYN